MTKDNISFLATWLRVDEFIQLGIYSASSFYRKAPKGEIPGAFKIGKKWFIDMQEFKEAHKPKLNQ